METASMPCKNVIADSLSSPGGIQGPKNGRNTWEKPPAYGSRVAKHRSSKAPMERCSEALSSPELLSPDLFTLLIYIYKRKIKAQPGLRSPFPCGVGSEWRRVVLPTSRAWHSTQGSVAFCPN